MQHRDALCSASVKKANSFEIDQVQFFEIQYDSWSAACDLGSHRNSPLSRIRVLRLPEIRSIFSVMDTGSETHAVLCNHAAIFNLLEG
jgi:hypothetical protein